MREVLMTISASLLVFVLALQLAELFFEIWTGGIPEDEAEDEPR